MYQFYYDHLKPNYGDNCTLLFTGTDSFCCLIQTDDIYRDMGEHAELFDTSNLEPTHPLYSKANHRVLGKFKSETGSFAPREFVGLRANVQFARTGSQETVKDKGQGDKEVSYQKERAPRALPRHPKNATVHV